MIFVQKQPEEPVTEVSPAEKQRKRLRRANSAVGAGCLGTIMLGGIFLILAISGITFPLILPAVIAGVLVVPAFFHLHLRTGKFRWLLYLSRTVSIGIIAAIYLLPWVCLRFEHSAWLFPLKRSIYVHGVRCPNVTDSIMPKYLPKQHDDYFFRTEPAVLAQDYTPFAYLALHTDTATLHMYEEKVSADTRFERRQNPKYTEEEISDMTENNPSAEYYTAQIECGHLPRFVYDTVKKRGGIEDDLTHAVIYQGNNSGTWHCGSGALINYETGLLIVWL